MSKMQDFGARVVLRLIVMTHESAALAFFYRESVYIVQLGVY